MTVRQYLRTQRQGAALVSLVLRVYASVPLSSHHLTNYKSNRCLISKTTFNPESTDLSHCAPLPQTSNKIIATATGMGNKPAKRGRKSYEGQNNKENQPTTPDPKITVPVPKRTSPKKQPRSKPRSKPKSKPKSKSAKPNNSEKNELPAKTAEQPALEKGGPPSDKSKKSSDKKNKKSKTTKKNVKTDPKPDQKTREKVEANADAKMDAKTDIKPDGKSDGKKDTVRIKPRSGKNSKKTKDESAKDKTTKPDDILQKRDKKPASDKAKNKENKGKSNSNKKPISKVTPQTKPEIRQLEQGTVSRKPIEKIRPAGKNRLIVTVQDKDKDDDDICDKSVISVITESTSPPTKGDISLSLRKNIASKPIKSITKKNIEISKKIKENSNKIEIGIDEVKTNKTWKTSKSAPFVIGEVSRPPKGKDAFESPQSMNASIKTFADMENSGYPKTAKTDIVATSLDSKIEVDLLSKSNGDLRAKEKNQRGSDEFSTDGQLTPIFKEEFEHLYDKIRELNRAVLILKESYRNLIRSLVKLSKQEKTKMSLNSEETPTERSQKTTNMLTTISDLKTNLDNTATGKERKSKKDTDINTRYRLPLETNKSDLSQEVVVVDSRFSVERFLNPITRDDTFRDLFNEVNTLNESLSKLKEFFDTDGDFMIQEYENSDYRISRNTFDMVRQKAQMLLTIVQQITRIYNQDLLDMFRIK